MLFIYVFNQLHGILDDDRNVTHSSVTHARTFCSTNKCYICIFAPVNRNLISSDKFSGCLSFGFILSCSCLECHFSPILFVVLSTVFITNETVLPSNWSGCTQRINPKFDTDCDLKNSQCYLIQYGWWFFVCVRFAFEWERFNS